jgi:hypothetical protein
MSARRMGAVLVVALCVAGPVSDADAQGTPPPLPLGFVDAPSPGLVAQAPLPAPAPPAPPAPGAQAVPPQPPLPAPASARPAVPARTGPRLTALSAVLVTGDEGPATGRGSATELEVPEAARKALASIASFLPYKSYSMVDAALISASSNSGSVVVMRDPALPGTSLRLALSPGGPPPPGVDTYEIRVALSEFDTTKPDDKTSRSVITAGVNVALGETVVVGTSRLGGGRKAYVLLLTAIGK